VRQLEQAQAIRDLCHKYQIPFLINDNVALAQQVEADGVHLGNNDVEIATARILLGDDAIIGASCCNQMDLARQALEEGATYVAFGRFFESATKPEAVHASVELLREAKEIFNCPLVAIGGITPDNGAELIAAGADCLAVIQGLFGQTDVITAAQRYAQLFPEPT
jgi:thiamine-phosphate pyrophosphorylase